MSPRNGLSLWDSSPTAVELQLQRPRWIDAVSKDPTNHEHVLVGISVRRNWTNVSAAAVLTLTGRYTSTARLGNTLATGP
eukprot:7430509-Pyramimonas_sp.AAC.1